MVVDGKAEIVCDDFVMELVAGDTSFVPAGLGDYTLKGKATVLLSTNPV